MLGVQLPAIPLFTLYHARILYINILIAIIIQNNYVHICT